MHCPLLHRMISTHSPTSTQKASIRVAIIGLGGYAGAHHDTLLKLEEMQEARLVCTCDPHPDAFIVQQQLLRLHERGVKVFKDYREMLDACGHELDVLVVPTPIPLHAEMHRAGVERGIAVYLEKPPTLDYCELKRMIETEKAARKSTLVGFNFIIELPRLELKRRLLSGEFGRLQEVRLLAEWARPKAYFTRNNWAGRRVSADGTLILDSCFGNAMAHFVHNLLFWAGEDEMMKWGQPTSVRAELYRAHAIEGPDTVFAEAQTKNGVNLRFALTHACHGLNSHEEVVVCEKAIISYVVGSEAHIRWIDGREEGIPFKPFDALLENHLNYYQYLRGEIRRPATTLVDSQPFVDLNTLIYLSSNEISVFPAEKITSVPNPEQSDAHLTVDGLSEALRRFLTSDVWPGAELGWRTCAPAAIVTPIDLNPEKVMAICGRNTPPVLN